MGSSLRPLCEEPREVAGLVPWTACCSADLLSQLLALLVGWSTQFCPLRSHSATCASTETTEESGGRRNIPLTNATVWCTFCRISWYWRFVFYVVTVMLCAAELRHLLFPT